MNKVLRPLRRAAVYGAFSYLGLVVINNSGLDLPSLWIAYLPMSRGQRPDGMDRSEIQRITNPVDRLSHAPRMAAESNVIDV